MKIEMDDGIQVDTDKLTDKDAAISEALDNLYKVCKQYDITSFTRLLIDEGKYMGMNTVTKNPKRLQNDYDFLMETIAKFVDSTSQGKLALMIASPEEEGPKSFLE